MSLPQSTAAVEALLQSTFYGKQASVEHASSSPEERACLGTCLLEASANWKRVVSPMLSYEMVQEALVVVLRESQL